MSIRYFQNLDLNQNEIKNHVTDKRGIVPSSPLEGQQYYDDVLKQFRVWDGTQWISIGSSSVQSISSANGTITVDNTDPSNPIITFVPLTINRALVSDAGGLPSASITTSTEISYVSGVTSAIQTQLDNKQNLVATPTNNDILTTDALGQSQDSGKSFSIDGTFATNSDNLIPTEKAIKTYIASQILAVPTIQGSWDASGNTYPTTRQDLTSPIEAGDYWIISVAGTLGGVAVEAGDFIYALIDVPGQTSTNWAIVEKNFGYTPEDQANKTDLVATNSTSSIKYSSTKGVYDFVKSANVIDTLQINNSAITPSKLNNYYTSTFIPADFTAGILTITNATHNLGTGILFSVILQDNSNNTCYGHSVNTTTGDVTIYGGTSGYTGTYEIIAH